MKVQITSDKYLTGLCCMLGNSNNTIEMDYLPDDEKVYYPAYQLLSKEVTKIITVNKPIIMTREEIVPILDENGNETGDTRTEIIEYYEDNFVEKEIIEIEYYYQLDEDKKQQIINDMQNPPSPPLSLKEKIEQLQLLADDYGMAILELQGMI